MEGSFLVPYRVRTSIVPCRELGTERRYGVGSGCCIERQPNARTMARGGVIGCQLKHDIPPMLGRSGTLPSTCRRSASAKIPPREMLGYSLARVFVPSFRFILCDVVRSEKSALASRYRKEYSEAQLQHSQLSFCTEFQATGHPHAIARREARPYRGVTIEDAAPYFPDRRIWILKFVCWTQVGGILGACRFNRPW